MTVARKTIRGRLTTLTEAQLEAGARVTLAAVEVLDDGTTRDIGRVSDLAGHTLMVADDTRSLTKEDGSYTFENVPVTDSTDTSPTGFALQLTIVSAGEVLEQVVFLLPESDPDEQWVDELAALGDSPLTPTYPQLVNQAVEALAAIPATITTTLTDDASAATTVIVGRINAAINALVNGAPGALNTLKEIADQLATDEGAASSVAAALATHAGRTDNPHATTKAQVGLGNVDNTSDAAKPVSTAQAAAIATAISNLVAGAPGALDTLNELATQLGSDETAAGNLTTLVTGIRNLSDSTHATALNNAFARHLTPLTAALGGTDVAAEIAAAFADPDVTEVRLKSSGASYYPVSATVVIPAGKRLTLPHGTVLRPTANVDVIDVKEDALLDGGRVETYLFDGYTKAAAILKGTATFGTSNVLTMVRNVRIRGKSGNVAGIHTGEGYGILLDSGTTGSNRISFAQFENIHIRGTSTAIAMLSRTPTSGVTWVNGNTFRGITISQPRRGVDLIRDATGASVTANYIDFQLQTGTGLESAYYDNGRGNVTHHTIWDYDLDSNVGDGTAVLTAADDRITTPSAHGLVVDQSVRFQTVTSATGLNPSVVYFITSVPTTTSFTVAEERGGTTIDLAVDGTATGLVSIRMAAYPMTLTERSQEGEVYTNLASYYIDNKGTNQVFSTSAVGRTGARFVGRVNGSSHLAKYGDQDDWLAWAIKRGVVVTQTAGTAPTGALDNLFDLNAANTCLFDGGPNVLEIDWTTGQRPSSLMLLFANGKYPTSVTVEAYRSGTWYTVYSTTANVQTSVSVGNFSPYNFQITKIRVTFSGLAPGKTAVEFERLAMFEQREPGNAYQPKATTRLVRKTTSTIRNNTGTPAADPDLVMTVEANAVYEVSGLLHYTGTTTGDLLISWSIPSGGSALYWGAPGLRLAATLQNDTVNMSSYASATSTHQLGAVGISNRALAQLRGLLIVGSSAGTISLKWSQNFAEVSDLTLLAGSYLKLEKVG